MRTRIDCCDGCMPPKRHAYCHTSQNCPEYAKQRAELDETNLEKAAKKEIACGIANQKARRVYSAERRRRQKRGT